MRQFSVVAQPGTTFEVEAVDDLAQLGEGLAIFRSTRRRRRSRSLVEIGRGWLFPARRNIIERQVAAGRKPLARSAGDGVRLLRLRFGDQ